jgi:hypothetical protein
VAAPPCASHPRAPATTTCAGCGLFLCAPCADPAPHCARCSGAAHPIPWEDPNLAGVGGHLARFWRTLKALVSADAFFARAPWTGGLGRPIAFAALAATVGAVASLLYGLVTSAALGLLLDQVVAALLPALSGSERKVLASTLDRARALGPALARIEVGVTLLTPVLTAVQLLILSALSHPLARRLGGTGTFEGTLRALAYGSGAAVLRVVPLVGGTLAMLGTLALSMMALRRAHGLSSGRAFVVAAWPIPAFGLAFLGLFLALAVQVARAF